MKLKDLIDQEILIWIPFLSRDGFSKVTLRGVESGGIWIESDDIAKSSFAGIWQMHGNPAGLPIAPVVFFPYHEIRFAINFVTGMTLNEKSLGL